MALIYPGGLTDTNFLDGTTSSAWQPQNYVYGGPITIPATGTVTQLGVHAAQDSTGPYGLKLALFESDGTLVASSTSSVESASILWLNSGSISAAVSAGTYYVFCSCETSNVQYGYSNTADGTGHEIAYASFPSDPMVFSAGNETGFLYGVRLDFTEGGGFAYDESLAPNGVTLVNLTGSYTDIDEDPDSPDSNWLTAI